MDIRIYLVGLVMYTADAYTYVDVSLCVILFFVSLCVILFFVSLCVILFFDAVTHTCYWTGE